MESKLYNPAAQSKSWLIENFVARTSVFKKIFKDLETGTMQYPEQNYLIQGQRGMGKTTLLLRLKYEIENTPKLSSWMVPVFFNEESYDLTSLSNLWEKLLKYLDNLWQTSGKYYEETDKFVGKDDYEKKCFELLIDILKTKQKKLVIFFDNFGQLFLDNLKDKEQRRFREILMNCNDIRIIGASAVVLQDLYDYSKPFFEFFKIVNLEGLNKDDTIQLIKKLQEGSDKKINIDKNKGKIETLAILTGGVIRTIMLIYEVILADEDGTALRDLEIILDRITPLYKHRIEDLPVQQRKIIDVIAKRWDAISTKEIAENIREDGKPMSSKLISAQLQQLEKNNIIEKKQTTTKNHLYQLNERFFNIWYLMRNGDRMDKCRVMWLTKFLESWYDDEASIKSFIKRHVELLKSGKYYGASAIMIAEALTYSSKVDFENQANLIIATGTILTDEQKQQLPQISSEKLEKSITLFNEEKYRESIKLIESIEQTSEQANTILFFSYLNIDNPQKAIAILNKSNKLNSFLLGMAYLKLNEFDKALKYLKDAIDKDNIEFYGVKGEVANALGWIYDIEKKDDINAEKYYSMALNFNEYDSFKNLVKIYTRRKDYKSVEGLFRQVSHIEEVNFKNELIDFYIHEMHDYKKATKLIDSISPRSIDFGDALYYRACIFNATENDRATALFIKAHDLYLKDRNFNDNYRMTVFILSTAFIQEKDKAAANKIAVELDFNGNSLDALMRAFIYIWNNEYKEGFDLILKNYLDIFNSDTNINEYSELLILLLIAKKQYHFTLQIFEIDELDLKDKLKPIYYALMRFMKKDYPNEHLKMGEELNQPVDDIIKRIDELAVDYA